jgi:S1-C subfamily serine protease
MTRPVNGTAQLRRSGALLLCAIGILQSANGYALDTREIYKIAEPSVAVVLASDAKGEKTNFGGGVLISPTEIVTSCKVIEAAADIVVTQGSALRKAALRYKDPERDLCQLHIDDPLPSGVPAVKPASGAEAEAGQELYAIGSPRGIERTINRTMVSGMREVPGSKVRLIEIDALLPGGMTGGGIFDQEAKLVGIIVAQFRQENSSYAAPAGWITELPNRSGDQIAIAMTAPSRAPGAASASSARDAKPGTIPRVGDRWKYRLMDGKRPVGDLTIEVVQSQGKVVRERIKREDEKSFVAERAVNAEFNPIRFQDVVTTPGGYQLSELSPYASADHSPKAGQQWADIPATLQLVQVGKKTLLMQVKVLRQEKVRVPAGEFDAILVEATGKDYFVQTNVMVTCRFWYSAQIMRTVKMTLQVDQSLHTNNSNPETYELVAFEPAK